MSKWELLCKLSLTAKHIVVVNWQSSQINTVRNCYSASCLPERLFSRPGFCEETCCTRGKIWSFDWSSFFDWGATGDSVSANETFDWEKRVGGPKSGSGEQPPLEGSLEDLSLPREKFKGSAFIDESQWKGPTGASLKNPEKSPINSSASVVLSNPWHRSISSAVYRLLSSIASSSSNGQRLIVEQSINPNKEIACSL